MMDEKYLPCPFCGSSEVREIDAWLDTENGEEQAILIECRLCDAQARKNWWNQRSPMAEVRQIMKEVKSND
jgi:predicted Fe-S protein YdhL (DUF1289 family)